MAEESFQEKTERATPKRKQEAREKGNVPRSIEVNSAAILLIVSLAFLILGNHLYRNLLSIMAKVLGHLNSISVTTASFPVLMRDGGIAFTVLMGPILLSIIVAGIVSNVIQSGLVFSGHSIEPKLEKISPASGFKRLFSLRSLEELIKNILKMLIIGYIGYVTLRGEQSHFLDLIDQDVAQILAFIASISLKLCVRVGVVFILLAILDFAYQKYEYEKNLKMTKQEVKDEYKQIEGDPLIKSRIRSMQRERARHRMFQDVPQADVVIVNPTHVAVALKYDPEKMSAPKVVAKGMRKIAEKIKQVAREHNIPVVERPLVARMLYKSANVGDEVPADLYQLVAEILAHVYQMKNKI